MEIIKIQFSARIIRIFKDGFTLLDKDYLIKFQDRKYQHIFDLGDTIVFVVENKERMGEEIIKKGYSVIYCILKNYLSNGVQFVDINETQRGFFWNYRGILTNKFLETSEPWEKDAILRMMIKRIS